MTLGLSSVSQLLDDKHPPSLEGQLRLDFCVQSFVGAIDGLDQIAAVS